MSDRSEVYVFKSLGEMENKLCKVNSVSERKSTFFLFFIYLIFWLVDSVECFKFSTVIML